MSVGSSIAQTRTISGVVISEDDGEPIIGASVLAKGTNAGTVTDYNGAFSAEIPSSATTLVVSYIGMTTKEVAPGTNMRITLAISSEMLDEVMVVAYGTTKKTSFTGSATTVKSEDLEKRTVSNITKALDGLAAGVKVTTGSGQPGADADINIRGINSINADSKPLIVVDGIPYDGQLSSINTEDIEGMTVLKDASAGALYGARGANGVVLITTKKGKSGAPEVSLKVNFGISSRLLPRYQTMKSKEFIEALYSSFYNEEISGGTPSSEAGAAALEAMVNGPAAVFGENQQYNPYNFPIAELIDINTGLIRNDAHLLWEDDWMDEITQNNALRQEYQVNISGGSDKNQYLLSLGYLNDKGILKTTDFQRYTGRANIETQPTEWFNAGIGTNLAHTKSNSLDAVGSSTSNVWYSAQLMGPIFPVYLRDRSNGGAFITDKDGNKQFDYGDYRPSGQQGNFNSVATLYDDLYQSTNNSASIRTHMDFIGLSEGWTNGLKFSVSFGADYNNRARLRYYNPYFGNASSSNGRVTKSSFEVLSYTFNQMLGYNRTFGDHHFDVMAAHEFYSNDKNHIAGEKTGFPFGGLYEPDAASTVSDVAGYSHKYRIESYLGRINYDYLDKYYFSASIRRDGSSRFQTDNRWGNFWSVGANYRLSQEDFMRDATWIDNLAARVSYGVQGNDALLQTTTNSDGLYDPDYYSWQALYDLGYSNGNEPGAIVNKIENRELSWETSHNLNIGLDFSFLQKYQVNVEWFNRRTTDLLLYYPLSSSTGFDGYFRNSGEMWNRGLELSLNARLIKTKDFNWNITLLGSVIRNKVTKLADDGQDILDGNSIIRVGESIYSYYLCRAAGVDPETGDQLYWATIDENGTEVEPYKTANTTYAQASRYVAGSKFADFDGSILTDLQYKNFDFSLNLRYSIGGEMIDGIYNSMMSFYYPAQTKHIDLRRAWKKPGDITDVPRFEHAKNYPATDNRLIDASFFAIKNVTLGYTLPTQWLRVIGLKHLRVYASGDNLALFTHLKGMDPQYSLSGGTGYAYTPSRVISFGVDVKF